MLLEKGKPYRTIVWSMHKNTRILFFLSNVMLVLQEIEFKGLKYLGLTKRNPEDSKLRKNMWKEVWFTKDTPHLYLEMLSMTFLTNKKVWLQTPHGPFSSCLGLCSQILVESFDWKNAAGNIVLYMSWSMPASESLQGEEQETQGISSSYSNNWELMFWWF